MNKALAVASVDLIPVLVVEQRRDILQSFWNCAPDRGPLLATVSDRGDIEGRVTSSNLGNALACHNLAHVDRSNWSNCRYNVCQDNSRKQFYRTKRTEGELKEN